MVLLAALMGWMFDGLEMGLFPLVARPALRNLLPGAAESDIARWFAVVTAGFLVGAATGGVLFGWLGDRIGRVRAMTLSVLTYALFSGLCGVATSASWVAVFRFIAALGMGGEWALGVALVMEIWPNKSRALMAGLIGAAANVGYFLIAVIGLGLGKSLETISTWFAQIGMPPAWIDSLCGHGGWRLLMLIGATPALLTFFIRLFVPESERWQREQAEGATSHWLPADLLGVLVGALGPIAIIYVWAAEFPTVVRTTVTGLGLMTAIVGYTFPVGQYLRRLAAQDPHSIDSVRATLTRMLLGASLAGVALLGTWGSTQSIPTWVDQLTGGKIPEAKAYTQMASSGGAVLGTIIGALLGSVIGRRPTYVLLCLASLGSVFLLYQVTHEYGPGMLAVVFLVGTCTASFYGWLPLYLPELFRTRVRATAQGFSFNFGRILAAVGTLQMANLVKVFETASEPGTSPVVANLASQFGTGYPGACTTISLVYLVGIGIIWLAPETKGRPLPD
jgi:MFS family permease